jgi:hypothetical protein
LDSLDFSIGSMMREDDGKETRVEEAHVETKEELEGGEVREEARRSVAAVGAAAWLARGSVRRSE